MTENELSSVHAPIDIGVSSLVSRYSAVVVRARDLRRNASAMGVNISLSRAIDAGRLNLTGLFDSSQLPQDSGKGVVYLRGGHPQQKYSEAEEIIDLLPLDLPKPKRPRRNNVTLSNPGRFGGYDGGGEGGSPTGNRQQPAKLTLKNR